MSKEFNIFNNLDEMMKCNFLAQIRTMDAANNSNGITNDDQNNDDEFDEIDSFLNNSDSKSPTKHTRKQKIPEEVAETKTNENAKTRRSVSPKERSLSPPMTLLDNWKDNLVDVPVSRRTRRSLGRAKKSFDQTESDIVETCITKDVSQMPTSSKRGPGGRGKGKGRGRGAKINSSTTTRLEDSFITDDSSNHSCDSESAWETELPTSVSRNSNTSASIMERFLDMGRQGKRGRMRNTRSRRNYVADLAARCQTIDSIDLINSPFPRVEGSITLDSDGEEEHSSTGGQEKNTSLDNSLDDDNPELSVKINWKGKPEAFKLRKYQKFSNIFKLLAEREGTDVENTVFNLGDRIIMPDDTPDSIGYKIFLFIIKRFILLSVKALQIQKRNRILKLNPPSNGRVLTTNMNSPLGPIGLPKKQRNANRINLKIQSDKFKRPLQINMLKTEKFRILYIKCSEELNIGIEHIKLSFDGETLELNGTPSDLDLEGGEAIDLRLKN